MNVYDRIKKAETAVRKITDFKPKIALTLGSGLGDFADRIDVEAVVPYSSIEGFPVSTVKSHSGDFLFGRVGRVPVVAMQGRVHYYEGYTMEEVVLPARLMRMLGAETLFLTNAAGGINAKFHDGTLMAITDHIMLAPNPLLGKNVEELGTRFPDMTDVYDRDILSVMQGIAKSQNIDLRSGVYIQVTGPSFETPAEIRAFRALGADAVGMSTACEAVAARHMGMRVAGISCITNMAAGMTGKPLSHDEVKETAGRIQREFTALVEESIAAIAKL